MYVQIHVEKIVIEEVEIHLCHLGGILWTEEVPSCAISAEDEDRLRPKVASCWRNNGNFLPSTVSLLT